MMKLTRRVRVVVVTSHVAAATAWTSILTAAVAIQIADHGRSDFVIDTAWIRWYVIIPLVVVTLLTGLILAYGTTWGFVRYRWLIIKTYLVMVLVGSGAATLIFHDTRLWPRLVALVLLILITAVSTVKPFGRSRWGVRRTQHVRQG